MERNALYKLLGVCSIILGVIGFLAVPRPGSAGHTGVGIGGVGTYYGIGAFHCAVFQHTGACGGNFALRVAIFVLFLVVGLFLLYIGTDGFASVGGTLTVNRPLGSAAGFLDPQATFHDVWVDEESEVSKLYWCRDCSFETRDLQQARRHKNVLKGSRTPVSTSVGVQPSAIQSAPRHPDPHPAEVDRAALNPEFKTCPDCAEQVRSAARKCRFCGYMFEEPAS